MSQTLQPRTQLLAPVTRHPSPSLLRRARRQSWLAAYLFLVPALLGLAIFRLYPIALAAWGSVHTTTFGGGAQRVFVGLDNYRYLLDFDVFWESLFVTLKLNLVINPLQIGLALLLAVLANQRVTGITIYRTIFFIPIGISVPIAALLWQTMLDPNSGLLNAMLSAVRLPRQPFLTSADQALWSVIAIASWKGVSFWMVFLLGGLQAIPGELHEAAMLDGASATRRFFGITLPLLKRTILFVLVTDTAINLLLFAPIYLLTRGGPELFTNVLMYEAFKTGFVYTDMGLALAMVMVLLGLVLVVVAAEFRLRQRGRIDVPRMLATFGKSILVHLLYILVCIVVVGPLLWALASSLRPRDEIFRYLMPFSIQALFPTTPTLEAYRVIFFDKDFGRAVLNTGIVAVATVVGGLLVAALAGFAFARLEFPGKRILFVLTVVTFLVPFEAIAIPLYELIQGFGWVDTYAALIVPGIANGIAIFLFRQAFAEIPNDLVDAARLDGASWLRILFSIFLPLTKPVLVGASLLLFLFQWESFLWPLIAVRDERYKVVQVALGDFQLQYQTLWEQLFAASIVAAVIPLLLLLPFQRFYVRSVIGTGLK